ncbi:hypothetical protein [Acutalibacter caecimuris]|uniref:hypothetical protein n=1 Tax=Acutalibacter caecimuris TaxID=3093657 RepID=UPI002AC9A06F|nr:hypothetical protein [Acutalibacter sp. M00118]
MEQRDLNRMFDQLNPVPGRAQALLDGILQDGTRREFVMEKRKRLVASVAVAILLMTCTIGAVASMFRVQITEKDEAGTVWLSEGIAYYPLESLSEKVRALDGQPAELFAFDSWEAVEGFIGLDLMNNPVLDAAPAKEYGFQIDLGHKKSGGQFVVITQPELEHIRAHGCFEIGQVDIDVESEVFTERMDAQGKGWDEKFHGYDFTENTELERETYTATSGLEAQIMQITYGEGHYSCMAAFSLQGIPTVVRANAQGSMEEARTVLLEVLDGFIPG